LQVFDVDAEFVALRSQFSPAFRSAVESAAQVYFQGDFSTANRLFFEASLARGGRQGAYSSNWHQFLDAASQSILCIMNAQAATGDRSYY
jgi:hypothetical protein